MTSILAAVDGSIYAQSVVDYAAWAAAKLGASVELLQVIGRRELSSEDRSGRLVAGARRQLLEELAALDAERAKLLIKAARLELEDASAALADKGLTTAVTLRHGDLLETLAEREATSELIVIGKRGQDAELARQTARGLHLGSNLERILRGASKPVLVASQAYREIRRVMVAFDGRPSAMHAVAAVTQSPLFSGAEIVLALAGRPDDEAATKLGAAAARLQNAGFAVAKKILPGAATDALPQAVTDENADLLVMGAFGHSRLRTLMIGSTTAALIQSSRIPMLVYR
ncbi:MAG: universal stress protein [Pseudomonadota bacterium]